MAYDEELSARFRDAAADLAGLGEKRMMGGLCFMLNGNMLGGADRTKSGEARFMFRVGKQNEAEALNRPGALPVDKGGRKMGGLVFVAAGACDDDQLKDWIALALEFVGELPAKS